MTTPVLIFLIFFLATITQTLTGFGSALVSMGLLSMVVGLQIAAPLYAILGLILEIYLLFYFRHSFNLQSVGSLIFGVIFGIPLGILALKLVDENISLAVLGFLLVGYALYGLSNFTLPRLEHKAWGYGMGFLAGVLGGAYNTLGPLGIIFGTSRRWSPEEFKANLQAYLLIGSVMITVGHAVSGNFTAAVWEHIGVTIAALALGLWVGLKFEKRISPPAFKKMVLVFLLLIGAALIF